MYWRNVRITALLSYLLLFAGGPGLHYAPIFGLHGHATCSHRQCSVESVCSSGCCGDQHDQVSIAGVDSNCDGSCNLCDFYSQVSPSISVVCTADLHQQAKIDNSIPSQCKLVLRTTSYSPRGPPRV